ncbi:transcriptional regulator [Lacticaseibacillus chiayiensis]|uniref:Helix-turn-helix domain-containing protein n=1 Tax=Lacticaseibacillus chiayiensis TaxID=2100821 RepID=A0A4Q1TUQ6_9LACO|nr:helix-turn-helix domain-containing protein [Lacticaseibacillus chiayiensis]QVI35914.1 helix-turn-helix domain-containing protein [Lacticaseibacillus chiayiensis]RXT22574.1 transcriptional regulator [Lacticaseibacillus chiayiensis]UYN57759.1 helix-turn-helix domain-containing protein [Lacticaseibacillus chiayiensis]
MAFEELFLDREERERLALYGDLRDAPNRQMNIATAAMARGESYRQLRRQMAKVAEDLQAIDPGAPPLLRKGDGNMTAPPSISRVRYRIFLFRRSLPGKLLVKTLMQPNLTLPILLEETGFSRAAFFRRISALRGYLRQKEVTINLTPLALVGAEPRIRQVYRQLLWQLVDADNPLFADVLPQSRQLVQALQDAGLVERDFSVKQLRFSANINLYRLQADHSIVNTLNFSELKPPPTLPEKLPDVFVHLPPEVAEAELLYLYLGQWRIPRFHTEQQFEAAGIVGYHAAHNTLAWQTVTKIRAELSRHLIGISSTITTDLALAGNLLKVLISEQIFPDGAYIDLAKIAHPIRAFYPRLDKAIKEFFAREAPTDHALEEIIDGFYQLLWPFMTESAVADKLKVALDPLMPQPLYETVRLNLIHPAFIRLVTIHQHPDFVISAQALAPGEESIVPDIPVFYLASERFESWSALYQELFLRSRQQPHQ